MLGLVLAAPESLARMDAALPADEILEKVEGKFGKVLRPEEAPKTYALMNAIFEPLSKAQELEMGRPVQNTIAILKSPMLNAFVSFNPATPEEGSVFLTTGLIRRMLQKNGKSPVLAHTQEEKRRAVARLAGVTAHELSHPLEYKDGQGSLGTGQAREIFSDTHGIGLSEKAGLPSESVYEALKEVTWSENPAPQKVLRATLNSHPQDDVRLSAQEVALTLRRNLQGSGEAALLDRLAQEFDPATLGELMLELEVAEPTPARKVYRPYRGFEEIEKAAEAQLREEGGDPIEAALLYRSLQRELDRPEALRLSPEEKARRYQLLARFADNRPLGHKWRKGEEKLAELAISEVPEGLRPYGDTAKNLKKIAFYQDPAYHAWLKERYLVSHDARRARSLGESPQELVLSILQANQWNDLEDLSRLLPEDQILSVFGEKLREGIEQVSKGTSLGPGLGNQERFASYFGKEQAPSEEFLELVDKRFGPKGQAKLQEWLMEALLRNGRNQLAESIFLSPLRRERDTELVPLTYSGKSSKLPMQLRLYRQDPSFLESLRKRYGMIWENRGLFAAVDLFFPQGHVNWEEIWAVLGIDHQTGQSQLIQGFRRFAETEEYAQLLAGRRSDQKFKGLIVNPKKPFWVKPSLWETATGAKSPGFAESPDRMADSRQLATYAVFGSNPSAYDETFAKEFQRRLRAQGLDKRAGGVPVEEWVNAVHQASRQTQEWLSPQRTALDSPPQLAMAIDRLDLPASVKADLLRNLYRDGANLINAEKQTSGAALRIARVLRKYEVLPAVPRLLEGRAQVVGTEGRLFSGLTGRDYSVAERVDALHGVSSDELSRIGAVSDAEARKQQLVKFAQEWFGPLQEQTRKEDLAILFDRIDAELGLERKLKRSRKPKFNESFELRQLKRRWLAQAKSLTFTSEEARTLFRLLASLGPIEETDEFFQMHLKWHLLAPPGSKEFEFLRTSAFDQLFYSNRLAVEATRRILQPELANVPANSKIIIDRVVDNLPKASAGRDELLEFLAWRLDLSGQELEDRIERLKTTNWKNPTGHLVNIASGVGQLVDNLDQKARLALLAHVLNPVEVAFPPAAEGAIREAIRKEAAESLIKDPLKREQFVEKKTEESLAKTRLILRDASQLEQVPLLNLILRAGRDPIAGRADYPLNLIRQDLGYLPGSLPEKALLAFLRVVPEQERTVSLAYLLSLPKGEQGELASIFKVFRSVGIKFGQNASIWKLFGEEESRKLAKLKDEVAPMPKSEVEALLSPEEKQKVKLKRILGSASIKTVVEVEITDPDGKIRRAAMLVQHPHAEAQIRTNLELSLRFLEELRKEGVELPRGMFENMVTDLKSQMLRELDMRQEAKALQKAKALYEPLNEKLAATLGEYRFNVPQPLAGMLIREDRMYIEMVDGMSWDRLGEVEKKAVGPGIAESSLDLFYREGWLDADRHGGNFLIDPKTKRIHVIDVAQAEEFTRRASFLPDDIYNFSQFARAVKEEDAANIARYARKMAQPGALAVRGTLEKAITAALAETAKSGVDAISNRWIKVVNAIAEAGVHLDPKFSLVAMKGHMTLLGEGYVEPKRFTELVSERVEQVLRRDKVIPAALEEVRRHGVLKCIMRFRKLATAP